MDCKTSWDYNRAMDRAVKATNYDARNFLIMVVLTGFPLGLIINREMPGVFLGTVLLPIPIIYYFTFYRWHAENKRRMQGFGPSAKVIVGKGMLELDDGKTRANLDLEDILELAVFIPEKDGASNYWWVVTMKDLEYILPNDAEGLESLLREFRDDQVFDTYPVDRLDIEPGRWTVWEKEGTG